MADGTIRVIIDPAGAVSGERKVRRALDGVSKSGQAAQGQAVKTRSSFQALTKSLIGPAGVVAGLAAVTAGLKATVSVAATFQKSVSELSAITGATGEDLEFLSDQAKELGRTTTFSASEVAEGFKLIASAKPDLLESGAALTEVTTQALTLAEAAGISLPEAATALGGALNQFQADADEASRFINVLAAGSQRGASEIPELTQALKSAGTVAAGAGLSFEATIANIETLAEVNLKGAEAGTNLRNIILRLQKEGVDELNPSVVGLTTALRNLNAQQRSDVELLKLFGTETFAAASALLVRTDRTDELTEAITGTLTAEEQAAINTDNLDGKVKELNSAIEGLGIAIGSQLLPAVEDSVSFFATYINVITDAFNATVQFVDGIDQSVSVLEQLQGAEATTIEDRIRQENQVLNDLLDANQNATLIVDDIASLGVTKALRLEGIEEQELFIAQLKKLLEETKAAQEGAVAGAADEDALEAARRKAEEAASLAEAERKTAEQQKRDAERAARDRERLAKQQESAFQRLRGQLEPLEQANRDLAAARAVLTKQEELGKISGEELVALQAQLQEAFADSIDPVTALNNKLMEERELAALSNEQRQIETRVRQELQELKQAGVEVTQAQEDAIRSEIIEIENLNAANTESVDKNKEVNEELELQKSILEELRGPQEDLNERIAALKVLLDEDKISLSEFNEQLQDLRLQTLQGQTTIEAGFERGFIKAQENLNDFASLSEKVVTDAFGGMEDGIVNFATTGKLEFSSLVDQILEDIVRLEARRALSSFFGAPAGQGEGGGSGLFGLVGGLLNQGGGTGGGTSGGGSQGGTGGGTFAQLAGIATSLFASNQDGGIETSPTISTLAEKGPEAIIPLKGGAVPVEVTQPDGGKPPAIIQNTFNISTPDPGAFGRSTGQIGNMVGQSFQNSIQRNG